MAIKLRLLLCCLASLFFIIYFTCGLNNCYAKQADLKNYAEYYQKNKMIQAGFAEAALMKQSHIKLISPDVQQQLQMLANEICVNSDVNLKCRVYIINHPHVGTLSTTCGDIIIPSGYLSMVENRDEIAFGLSREIAIQHRQLPLKDMKARYEEREMASAKMSLYSLVTSYAINTTFNHYVSYPIQEEITKTIKPTYGMIPFSAGNSQFTIYGNQVPVVAASVLNLGLGWIPDMATNAANEMLLSVIKAANEEADEQRRILKNDLGLVYMQAAGYDPNSGQNVISKIEKFRKEMSSEQ